MAMIDPNVLIDIDTTQDLWVFGYGSLMWKPGFDFIESCPSVLNGYHRSFCIFSHHYRGTHEAPGLVLGLDRGVACSGVAFKVEARKVRQVVDYLNERELVNYPYIPKMVELVINQGEKNETVTAYTFIADDKHPQYAGEIDKEEASTLIMRAKGIAGLNRDYLINTVRHLEDVGYHDDTLHALLVEVERQTGLIEMGSGI